MSSLKKYVPLKIQSQTRIPEGDAIWNAVKYLLHFLQCGSMKSQPLAIRIKILVNKRQFKMRVLVLIYITKSQLFFEKILWLLDKGMLE
jgi:hypothetical protein